MRNRRKTLLRDHSVPEVTIQSQPYLRPSPLEDLKNLSMPTFVVGMIWDAFNPIPKIQTNTIAAKIYLILK